MFFDGILENVQNQKLLDIYIKGSGKSLNDFGNEYICDYKVRRNVSYLTLHFFWEQIIIHQIKKNFSDKIIFILDYVYQENV